MGMTLKEAIQHLDETLEDTSRTWECDECRKEHEQLREWLIELSALRKAQEPRLLTPDLPASEWHDKVIWLEINGKETIPCLFRECSDRMMFGRYERLMYFDIVGSSRESGYMLKNYGVKWRCWTQKPPEEQRKATPWNLQ